MKTLLSVTLAILLALPVAAQTTGIRGMERTLPEVSRYCPVGYSCFDYSYPWRTDAEVSRPGAENPGVAGIGVNFLIGECGEVDGLLLNLGLYGKSGSMGGSSSMCGVMRGVTAGLLVNANGPTEGLMAAPVNVGLDIDGCMVGLVNAGRRVRGLQVGLVNVVDSRREPGWVVQIGLYNSSDVPSFQLGLINEIRRTTERSTVPLVNYSW